MIVFKKARDLIDHTFIMTDNPKRYPKKYRFTFVNRMQDLTLDIYKKLSKTNEVHPKYRRNMQIDVLGDVNVLLTLIDISLERGFVDSGQAKNWSKKALDVKYLTAAWMKQSP